MKMSYFSIVKIINMKGVNNLTKWESVIEWFDDKKYLNLSDKSKQDLKDFRKVNHYIQTLKNSIEKHQLEIEDLKKQIIQRSEKIRKHKNKGNTLYDRLVNLKDKNEISLYYSEGITTKKLKGNNWSRGISEKTYHQINIKYKSKNSKKLTTINLGTTRDKLLKEIKLISPNWYNEKGRGLVDLNWSVKTDSNRLKFVFVSLIQPLLEEILEKNKSKKDNNGVLKINWEQIKGIMKKRIK